MSKSTATPQIDILPLHSTIAPVKGKSRNLPCLVALRASETMAPKQRRPLNLAIVLDCSGSMDGGPLIKAKQAVLNLLDTLTAMDRVAIVGYSNTSGIVVESTLLTDKEAKDRIRRRIEPLRAGGGTNLHDGWLTGAHAIAHYAQVDTTSRIILFSDGQANVGITDTATIAQEVGKLSSEGGITTSTYGIGHSFNENLMTAMARSGRGQSFYAQDAAELTGYFATELRLLERTLGTEVVAKVKVQSGKKHPSFRWMEPSRRELSDLVAGATSWGLGEISVPAGAMGKVDVEATMTWRDAKGTEHTATGKAAIRIGKADSKPNSEVEERVREQEAAQLQLKAAEEAKRQDWQAVSETLDILRSKGGQNAYVNQVTNTLLRASATGDASLFAKEAQYGAVAMATRQVSLQENPFQDSADPLGLRKAEQGKAAPTMTP